MVCQAITVSITPCLHWTHQSECSKYICPVFGSSANVWRRSETECVQHLDVMLENRSPSNQSAGHLHIEVLKVWEQKQKKVMKTKLIKTSFFGARNLD